MTETTITRAEELATDASAADCLAPGEHLAWQRHDTLALYVAYRVAGVACAARQTDRRWRPVAVFRAEGGDIGKPTWSRRRAQRQALRALA